MKTEQLRRVEKARAILVASQPFFGALALRLTVEETATLETMDVDGFVLRYAPAYVDQLTDPELIGVIAHEIMHCAVGHPWRQGTRDAETWNRAADLSINPILDAAKFTLPKGAQLDPAYTGMSAEAIYGELQQAKAPPPPQGGGQQPQQGGNPGQQPQPGNGQGQGQGQPQGPQQGNGAPGPGTGTVSPAPSPSPAQAAQDEAEWKIAATQAAQAAKACGKLPAEIDVAIANVRQPKVDWRATLRRFITQQRSEDYTWTPPNRRYVAQGLYLPAIKREAIGRIVVGVDVSGSVTQAELDAFGAELSAIAEDAQPEAVTVLYCNTRITGRAEFAKGEPIALAAKGKGGTDFRPVFEAIESEDMDPLCLIYLTDLAVRQDRYPTAPGYPVLWTVTGRREDAPFGEIVKLDVEA